MPNGYEIAGIIIAAQVPTWIALWKTNRDIGRLQGRANFINGRYNYVPRE